MHQYKTFAALFTIALATHMSACATDVEDEADGFRIIEGDPAPSHVPEYAATVGIHVRSGDQVSAEPFCSGTLIRSDVVMTAGHCCDESKGGPKSNPMEPEEIAAYFGEGPAFSGASINGEFYGVSEVSLHPSYNKYSLDNDICLLRLQIANTDTTPIPNLPSAVGLSNADAGTLLDHVGFGYADFAFTEYGVKLHADVPLAGLGCVVAGCPSGASDRQFSYEQDGSPYFGPCSGDSGGPAFIQRGGTTYVAGITSYGDASCSQYGVSTNVSAFESYIEDFAGDGPPPAPDCSADGACNPACAAGDDPDCGGGDGGDGGTPDDCGDGTCGAGESCDGRGGTTACGDCDGVTNGRPSNRYCFVEGTCEGPGC